MKNISAEIFPTQKCFLQQYMYYSYMLLVETLDFSFEYLLKKTKFCCVIFEHLWIQLIQYSFEHFQNTKKHYKYNLEGMKIYFHLFSFVF